MSSYFAPPPGFFFPPERGVFGVDAREVPVVAWVGLGAGATLPSSRRGFDAIGTDVAWNGVVAGLRRRRSASSQMSSSRPEGRPYFSQSSWARREICSWVGACVSPKVDVDVGSSIGTLSLAQFSARAIRVFAGRIVRKLRSTRQTSAPYKTGVPVSILDSSWALGPNHCGRAHARQVCRRRTLR